MFLRRGYRDGVSDGRYRDFRRKRVFFSDWGIWIGEFILIRKVSL